MSYKESVITLIHHQADDPSTVDGNLPDTGPEFNGWHIISLSYDPEVGVGALVIMKDFREQLSGEALGGVLYAIGSLGEGFVRNLVITDSQGNPTGDTPGSMAWEADKATKIEWTVPMLRRLKISYDAAVSSGRTRFTFDGNEYLTGFAKYLIEYVSTNLGVRV